MADNWLTDLRYGIASVTAAESDSLISWRDSTPYTSDEIGIFGVVLPESPDEAISLNLYLMSESPVTVMGAQFRFRARTDARLDLIENVLSNCWSDRWGGTLGSVPLVASAWASGTSLGQDQNGRLERSMNIYLTVDRPLSHRTT